MLDLLADAMSSEKASESTATLDRGNVLDSRSIMARRSACDSINCTADWGRWAIDNACVIVSIVSATKDPTDVGCHSGGKHALPFAPGSKKLIASVFV
jgi:hypothetical protein